jgi:hypothetical protein
MDSPTCQWCLEELVGVTLMQTRFQVFFETPRTTNAHWLSVIQTSRRLSESFLSASKTGFMCWTSTCFPPPLQRFGNVLAGMTAPKRTARSLDAGYVPISILFFLIKGKYHLPYSTTTCLRNLLIPTLEKLAHAHEKAPMKFDFHTT